MVRSRIKKQFIEGWDTVTAGPQVTDNLVHCLPQADGAGAATPVTPSIIPADGQAVFHSPQAMETAFYDPRKAFQESGNDDGNG